MQTEKGTVEKNIFDSTDILAHESKTKLLWCTVTFISTLSFESGLLTFPLVEKNALYPSSPNSVFLPYNSNTSS